MLTQLKEIVEKENINLDEYVTFVTDNQKVLAANVKVISFARNFGHQAAVTAGLKFVTGDVILKT